MNANALVCGFVVAYPVIGECEVVGFAEDADTVSGFFATIIENLVVLESVAVAAHRFGLIAKENAFTAISERTVVAKDVVGVFVTNGNAGVTVSEKVVVFKKAVLDTPAKKETDAAIVFRVAQTNGGVLAAAARVQAKVCVASAGAVFYLYVLALLEADAIAVIVFDRAVCYCAMVTAIEKDARASTAIEVGVVFFVAVYDQVLYTRIFEMIAANDRERCGCARIARGEVVATHRHVDAKGIAITPKDGAHSGMKPTAGIVGDANAITDFEFFRMFNCNLFFAKISIECKWAFKTICFPQGGIPTLTSDGNVAAQMQRISHDICARLDFDGATAQCGDIIDGSLYCPVVVANNGGIFLSYSDV